MKAHGPVADLFGIALLVAGGAMTILLNFIPIPPPTAEEIAAATKAETRQASDAQRACEIYKASGSPASFKLIKAVRTTSGDLCLQYRIDAAEVTTCDGMRGKEITRAIRDGLKSC